MQASNAQREYFNLHTSGVGYLSRVRWVTPQGRGRKSEPFLACAISALRGSSDSSDTTYFDLRVSGAEAIGLIDSMKQSVDERRKVTVTFRIADTYPHVYERDVRDQQTGRPTGQKEMAALIKGRLILIYSISVDGESVYKRSADGAEPAGEDAPREPELQGEGFYQDESWPEEQQQQQQQPRQAPQHAPQQEAPRGAQQQRPENAQWAGAASQGYAQPRQAAAPAARGHGPSAYARRPAPHSGAGYREPAGQR
ncbi:hypothetical protein DR66_3865 [Delftia acidovorans]|uniref:DUF3577 domain-containing protein n=1 Tax=Delftia acidovorans TaxID=80866 RepID=UPI00050522DF|nr:DUF3577 domain-containing protein [Delftia acidovorans]KFJ12843.1 hypothetical protein DR66_3865 [Delftia acidovorans]QQB53215.1 DUF3577 domain-containing protein [Delftia acidovorans]